MKRPAKAIVGENCLHFGIFYDESSYNSKASVCAIHCLGQITSYKSTCKPNDKKKWKNERKLYSNNRKTSRSGRLRILRWAFLNQVTFQEAKIISFMNNLYK